MLKNNVSHRDSTGPSPATPPRLRRVGHVVALAGMLVVALLLALHPASPIYALITPPHTPDFTATGENPAQQFGFSVASAGDINNDGFGDVLVGASGDVANLGNKIFVYQGSPSGMTTTVYFSATGLVGENLGWSLDGGGDVTNDGIDDFIVSAPISGTGAAYVYAGSSTLLPTRVATLTGETAGDRFGWSVAIIGDVNNDGDNDIAVGAPRYGDLIGRVYVYYGPVIGSAVPYDVALDAEGIVDKFGSSVSGAGDVDGDGIDDLLVGAPENTEGGNQAGKAYVFYGSDTGVSQDRNTAVIGGPDDKLGTFVHGAGDVNGDGFADVIVGADTYSASGEPTGRAEIYPGGPAPARLITTTLYTAFGETDDDRFSFALAGDGDLDGDGFSDFAVGAHEFDATGPLTDTGKAYGYVACSNGTVAPTKIFSGTGEAPLNSYGRSLAIVEDVNGDDIDDLVVGAYGFTFATGKIYAYYGVEGGCQPEVGLLKTVGLQGFPTLYTNTSVITVPTDAVVRYNYLVTNTGNVTLTQHSVIDSKLGNVAQAALSLIPGASYSVNITSTLGVSVPPGISVTNVATWTGATPISSPSGATNPPNKTLSTFATATARVNVSLTGLDQDGDGIPDNVEGSGNPDGDALPNFLDLNSDGDDFTDAVEAGPDPNNPIDRDSNGVPAYLDPDENPDTEVDEEILGLAVNGPARAIVGQTVNFNAAITAGTNVTYTWAFGDSGTGTGQNVSHRFAAPGFYIVEVTATNSLGELKAQKSIIIQQGTFMPSIKTIGTGQ